MLNEIISCPKLLTSFWEGSHLITPKIKHNTDIFSKLEWLVPVNLSILSSTHLSYALIFNSPSFSGIGCCCIQVTTFLAVN